MSSSKIWNIIKQKSNRTEPKPGRARTEPQRNRTRTDPKPGRARTEPEPNQTRTEPKPDRAQPNPNRTRTEPEPNPNPTEPEPNPTRTEPKKNSNPRKGSKHEIFSHRNFSLKLANRTIRLSFFAIFCDALLHVFFIGWLICVVFLKGLANF